MSQIEVSDIVFWQKKNIKPIFELLKYFINFGKTSLFF